MFWFPTKKEVLKEFDKIKNSLMKNDYKTESNETSLKKLKEEVRSNNTKIARLEGMITVILNKSQSQKVPILPKKSQDNIETRLLNRVRRGKKALVIAEIEKLRDSHKTIEMYDVIVLEKGLCSKASFYRYIEILKSQRINNETKIRHS